MASSIDPEKVHQIQVTSELETENISRKPRFGLFQQPPPLSVHYPYSDVPYNHRVGQVIAPVGSQKNPSILKLKKGKNDEVLFSRPGYTTIGDTYQDPEKLERHGYHNGISTGPVEFNAWKDNDQKKTVIEPPYPYISNVAEEEQGTASRGRRGKRLHDGSKTQRNGGKRQFSTGANILTGTFGEYGYGGDDYANKNDMRRTEMGNHRGKIPTPWGVKTNIHEPFNPDMFLKNDQNYRNNKPPATADKLNYTRFGGRSNFPWKNNNPAKVGYNKTLNQIPYYHRALQYKEKLIDKRHEEKIWIPNFRGTLEKPSPAENKFYRNNRARNTSQGVKSYRL